MWTGSFQWPGGRDPEVAGEVLVRVFWHDEPGGPQDGPGVLAWRGEDVDGVVASAVGDDEPLVVGENDAGPLGDVSPVGGLPDGSSGRAPGGAGGGAVDAVRGGTDGLPSAAGKCGGGLGGERGRCEDAGGEQDVFEPARHAAGRSGDVAGLSGVTRCDGERGWRAGRRHRVRGAARLAAAGRSRRGGAGA